MLAGGTGMAHIRKEVEENGQTTILVVAGIVAAEELIEAFKDFYHQGFTPNLVWDATRADLTELSTDQLRQIFSIAKEFSHLRKSGKTAIVVAGSLGFGMGRMYEIFCELDNHPIPLRVFKAMAEAREWLAS